MIDFGSCNLTFAIFLVLVIWFLDFFPLVLAIWFL